MPDEESNSGGNSSGSSPFAVIDVEMSEFKRENPDGEDDISTKSVTDGGGANGQVEIDSNVKDGDGEKPKPPPPVGAFKVFQFASKCDVALMVVGLIAAILSGCSLPGMFILFGDLLNVYVDDSQQESGYYNDIKATAPQCLDGDTLNTNCTALKEAVEPKYESLDFTAETDKFSWGTSLLGLGLWIAGYIYVTCFNYAAENQAHIIRCRFLRSVLKQDISWYDLNGTVSFASKMTEDLDKLQDGIGEKVPMIFMFLTTFFASIVTAFIFGWELTLVIFAVMPIMMVSTGILAKAQTSMADGETDAYSKAGAVAEEVFSSLRTVLAFGGQEKETIRYAGNLKFARSAGIKRGLLTGLSGGLTWFMIFGSYALAFWYGTKLIMDDIEGCIASPTDCHIRYDSKALLIVFFAVLMGAFQVGQSGPHVEAFSMGRSSAGVIFDVIHRKPQIDSSSKEGIKPSNMKGHVKFMNVNFNYPSRPSVKILKGLSFEVKQGQTVALVGASGCGKSTCIQLLQRFYDPLDGKVLVDGEDIKDLNVKWLRSHVGIVSQEPVLFNLTIRENLLHGKKGATEEEIIQACKDAHVYNFIRKLPKGFDTLVGEGGTQLSGGQKQRISIARAIIRQPKILLLDEATSALDNQSEAVVQKALDKASAGRTTIVVAHRLSTVRRADKIIVLQNGSVVEEGPHDKLMVAKGVYYNLVSNQMKKKTESFDDFDDNSNVEELLDAEEAADELLESAKRVSREGSLYKRQLSIAREHFNVEVEEDEENTKKVSLFRVLKAAKSEWGLIFLGAIASAIMGAIMPAYGYLFGEVLGILAHEPDVARKESVKYAGLFLGVGAVAGLAMFFQLILFAISGENFTMVMRKNLFEALVNQEVGWHDNKNNNTGAICARLSSDASKMKGATGSRVGTVMQSLFTLIISIVLCLYYNWKLGLVSFIFIPFLIFGLYMQTKILNSSENAEKKTFEKSATLAIEAISNIKTVAGLGIEDELSRCYEEALSGKQQRRFNFKFHSRGFLYGFAVAVPMVVYAIVTYYGTYLIKNEGLHYTEVFKVVETVVIGAFMIGQAVAFAPDYEKGLLAASRSFELLARKPLIDTKSAAGLKLSNVSGDVEFKEANFHYPTRKNVQVLKDFNLALQSGQSVALVGESGCGKSTCIQLLQRFYDLENGTVELDNHDIQRLNVAGLRSNFGLVSQEPVLFDRTIAENIMYGDNSREVTMEEVIDAARKANIHNFIASLPAGYDTMVGGKGTTQLSGGQKQRVAIARALIRSPKILLLDEATSALDSESEKVVQDALDKAMVQTTCITIAHRLSTIANANKILVIDQGKIIESGTHEQLLKNKNGVYFMLWNTQHS